MKYALLMNTRARTMGWAIMTTAALSITLPAFAAEMSFEPKSGADPLGKSQTFGIRLLFNNMSAEGHTGYPKMGSFDPGVGFFYGASGKEIGFNVYGGGGLATSITYDKSGTRETIPESRSYFIELGADLNYIIMNANRWFVSAGLAEHTDLGGMTVDQTTLKTSFIPFANLLGLNVRARYYALDELFFSGMMGFHFLSVHSQELQAYKANGTDPGLTSVTMENPTAFQFEILAHYRPGPPFAFHGGVQYRTLSYRANDPSALPEAVKSKSFSYFLPTFGITLLF